MDIRSAVRVFQSELGAGTAIPVGPDNTVELGGPDSGQPTYFLPRRQRFVFRIRVPRDFGKKEVVWSITANGRTEHAFGSLIREQEITERVVLTNGGYNPGLTDPNKPPAVTVAPIPSALAGAPVTLTVSVTDDGLPKPRAAPAPRQTSGHVWRSGQFNDRRRPPGGTHGELDAVPDGPAKVTFETTGAMPVVDGRAVTTARFAEPGTYQLVASASDRAMTTRIPVTVTVGAPANTLLCHFADCGRKHAAPTARPRGKTSAPEVFVCRCSAWGPGHPRLGHPTATPTRTQRVPGDPASTRRFSR